MARIASFTQMRPTGYEREHPTEVDCAYKSFASPSGRRLLQFDTCGSAERENPGKASQTLQVDQSTARKLIEILSQFLADA